MNKISNRQNHWFRWMSYVLVAAMCLVTLTPATSVAAQAGPEAVDVSPGSYMPFLRNNVCTGTRAPEANKLGVQVYGATGYPQGHFTLLQNTRSNWIRNTIFWPSVEPNDRNPNQYRWGPADSLTRAAVDNCANMIITIDNTPAWAATEGERSPFKSNLTSEFVEFVTALVERYDGDGIDDAPSGAVINHWEFYNEPDFGGTHETDGWGNHGARYAEMLKAVYPAVKAANPKAKVIFGGIAYNLFVNEHPQGLFVRQFLENVLKAGGDGTYFDYMNVHHYPFPNNRENWTDSKSSGLVEKIGVIKDLLAKYGQGDIPVMVTEVGWHNDDNDAYPSSDVYQSRHVVQLLTQALATGAPAALWWAFFDTGGFPYNTGLTATSSNSISARPSYNVYNEAVERLGPSEFLETMVSPTAEEDLEVYKFRDPASKKVFYVAWLNPIAPFNKDAEASFDDNVTQVWQVAASRASLFAMDGRFEMTINDIDDGVSDGMLTITVGRNPTYIVVE